MIRVSGSPECFPPTWRYKDSFMACLLRISYGWMRVNLLQLKNAGIFAFKNSEEGSASECFTLMYAGFYEVKYYSIHVHIAGTCVKLTNMGLMTWEFILNLLSLKEVCEVKYIINLYLRRLLENSWNPIKGIRRKFNIKYKKWLLTSSSIYCIWILWIDLFVLFTLS